MLKGGICRGLLALLLGALLAVSSVASTNIFCLRFYTEVDAALAHITDLTCLMIVRWGFKGTCMQTKDACNLKSEIHFTEIDKLYSNIVLRTFTQRIVLRRYSLTLSQVASKVPYLRLSGYTQHWLLIVYVLLLELSLATPMLRPKAIFT